jgi:hypothetical protein
MKRSKSEPPGDEIKPAKTANTIAVFAIITNVVLTIIIIWQASRQNKSSLQANQIALELKTIETSPIIGVMKVKFDSVEIGKPLSLTCTIINTGRAPAYISGLVYYLNARPWSQIDQTQLPYDQNVNIDTYLFENSLSINVPINGHNPLSKELYDSLVNYKLQLWFGARIYYDYQLLHQKRCVDYSCYTSISHLDSLAETYFYFNDTTFRRF